MGCGIYEERIFIRSSFLVLGLVVKMIRNHCILALGDVRTIFANIKEAFISGYRFSRVDMVRRRSLVFSCSTEGLLLVLKRL